MKKILTIILLIFAIPLTSCSAKRMATNVVGKIALDGMGAMEDERDVALARETSPSLIKTMEVLKAGNPKSYDVLVVLSKSYGQFAFGFLEEDMLRYKKGSKEYKVARERADLFFARGKEYGIQALSNDGAMREGLKSSFQKFNSAVKRVGKKYVPALFWTAFNWSGWLNLNLSDPAAIIVLPKIEAMIKRVIELDPDYNYGSAHSLLAVLSVSRPKMLGGNPSLAKEGFAKAMSISPNYLMTKVLYAQYYAKLTQNEDLFVTSLGEVEISDASALPEQRLANELAKRRARLLLEMKDRLF